MSDSKFGKEQPMGYFHLVWRSSRPGGPGYYGSDPGIGENGLVAFPNDGTSSAPAAGMTPRLFHAAFMAAGSISSPVHWDYTQVAGYIFDEHRELALAIFALCRNRQVYLFAILNAYVWRVKEKPVCPSCGSGEKIGYRTNFAGCRSCNWSGTPEELVNSNSWDSFKAEHRKLLEQELQK